jgi:carboxyl-terminal processing protease
LSDGTTVFVNVDEDSEAYRQGIREGFTITEFDGEDIDSLKDRSYVFFYEFPDRENEKFFSALFATAEGGEEAYVTYLDDSGTSNTVTVHEQGNNYQRMKDTRTKLLGFERDEDTNNNLSYYMVDDKTACLVINELDIESDVRYGDVVSTQYSGLAKMIGSQIQAIKDEGAENLIIDMRGNYGGYLEVSLRLASYFTDEELFGAYEGESTDTPGVYNKLFEADVEAGNIWGDGSIVILVNAETISAAELFIHMMKQLDNVTVIGMTKSCGSAMGVGDIEGENITMYYPDQMLLDEDMDIMIDAGEDRVMDMAPDIIIPLDKDAFVSIFENNEDYVLNYAVRYLEQ